MTSPNPVVGVTKQKNYYTDKKVTDIIHEGDQVKKHRYVFDSTMKTTSSLKDEKDKLKRDLTVEKFKLMRKIISNEKKVSYHCKHFEQFTSPIQFQIIKTPFKIHND